MKIINCLLVLISFAFISFNNLDGRSELNKTVELEVFNNLISYQYLYKSAAVKNGITIETYEIKYKVDGLMITGYIHKPLGDLDVYPGKIYYKAEHADKGNFGRNELEEQRSIAAEGFVVLSSQLRGNICSQGTDETGSQYINDILGLFKIAACLSFVDSLHIEIYDDTKEVETRSKVELIKEEINAITTNCDNELKEETYHHKIKVAVFNDLISYQYLYMSDEAETGLTVETYEIKYRVDGLMITGYINKPIGDLQTYPAIIYCRGGNRDLGTFGRGQLRTQRKLASQGFVVLSSQLRGNIFSQGTDEMGGADLKDILKLIEIAQKLPSAKGEKIGIHGVSRGGRSAYQISRLSDEISSVSVIGTSVDIRDSHSYRPEKYTRVNLPLIGDTINFKHEYDKRSPILWVDELNEPLLILHGTDDWRSKVEKVKRIIPELEKHNKEFEYYFIEDGSHTLGSNSELRDSLVVQWHKKYLK